MKSKVCNETERASKLDDLEIDGTPFSILMSQAVKLKNAQDGPTRSRYDSYPSFYQNSLFSQDEVVASRNKPFNQRMIDAMKWKKEGNEAMDDGDFTSAIIKYEIAISVFKYLENHNPNWKNEGIRDQDITENSFNSDNRSEINDVQDFLTICCTNIAIACIKSKQFVLAVDACNEVLRSKPSHVKALYLRSKALVSPKSAGATEDEMAISDLKRALMAEPKNLIVRNELKTLVTRCKTQSHIDKMTFSGLFTRGTIYGDMQLQKNENTKKDLSLGREKQESLFDFDNPTAKMVQEAANRGIDLKDPEVIHFLKRLQINKKDTTAIETKSWTTGFKEDKESKTCSDGKLRVTNDLHLKAIIFGLYLIVYYFRNYWREI